MFGPSSREDFFRFLERLPGRVRHLVSHTTWWFAPIAAVILLLVGWTTSSIIERGSKMMVAEQLQTILEADVTGLRIWMSYQKTTASSWGRDPTIVANVKTLQEIHPFKHPAQKNLRERLSVICPQEFFDYEILSPDGVILSTLDPQELGLKTTLPLSVIENALSGIASVTKPFRHAASRNKEIRPSLFQPLMVAASPIQDDENKVIGALILKIRPSGFTRFLTVARMGETGETYAFDRNGLLLSESRFGDQLREIGILGEHESAILNLRILDPGGNLLNGYTPDINKEMRATKMIENAVGSSSIGIDVEGYRDYRGVDVVGAWIWLPEFGFGVTTEVDVEEAYRLRILLRQAYWILIGLLIVGTMVLLLTASIISALRSRVHEIRKLGQYTLEEKIGEGSMGQVFKAKHSLLRRPTAIKLLPPSVQSQDAVEHFELEVQLTSQLSHPNTIAIYDYGHTPDGYFYYVMEYLDGMTLDTLVKTQGAQPPGRVLHILKQICGSLAEAHEVGLIHRDIKPANVMLCRRGNLHDVVKVLDFGLVKDLRSHPDAPDRTHLGISGTPLFISPEGISAPESMDARSDLYSLGAVGYYLLTGNHVFEGESIDQVFEAHLTQEPVLPHEATSSSIHPGLEDAVMQCLKKQKSDRPEDARNLLSLLSNLTAPPPWTEEQASQAYRLSQGEKDSNRSTLPAESTVQILMSPRKLPDATPLRPEL